MTGSVHVPPDPFILNSLALFKMFACFSQGIGSSYPSPSNFVPYLLLCDRQETQHEQVKCLQKLVVSNDIHPAFL